MFFHYIKELLHETKNEIIVRKKKKNMKSVWSHGLWVAYV